MVKKPFSPFTVPLEFCIAPFYKPGDMIHTFDQDGAFNPPFVFDMIFNKDMTFDGIWPWESFEKVQHYFLSFDDYKEHITQAFRHRQKVHTKPLMRIFISRFIEIAFWSHHQPVLSLESISNDINQLEFVPVNVEERIQFILDHPNHHLSFVQLAELYTELEKKLARGRVMRQN